MEAHQVVVPVRARCRAPLRLVIVVAAPSDCAGLSALLRRLPRDFAPAVAIVHQWPSCVPDSLPAVLRKITSLDIVPIARSRVPLEANTIFLAPQHLHLYLDPDGYLSVGDGNPINGRLSSPIPLLATAAVELGPSAAVVVFPGSRADAAEGIAAIERAGGKSLFAGNLDRAGIDGLVAQLVELAKTARE